MVGFSVRMSARASLRCGLLVDVLDDRGDDGKLVEHDAVTDDELRRGADCLGYTCQAG